MAAGDHRDQSYQEKGSLDVVVGTADGTWNERYYSVDVAVGTAARRLERGMKDLNIDHENLKAEREGEQIAFAGEYQKPENVVNNLQTHLDE